MEVSYREFTSLFLNSLKNQRDQLLSEIKSIGADICIKNLLISLRQNDEQMYQYANFIQSKKALRRCYKKLTFIEENIAQSSFEDKIDEIRYQLDDKLQKLEQQNSNVHQSLQFIINRNSQIKGNFSNESIVSQENAGRNNENHGFEKSFTQGTTSKFSKSSVRCQQINREKSIKPAQPKKYSNQQQRISKIKQRSKQIDQENLQVQIRFEKDRIDIDNYSYNQVSLKQSFGAYIRKQIKQKPIIVQTKSSEVQMFTDIVKYVKSKDAGNYRFNPFLDVVEVYIKTKDNSIFDYDFKVIGNIDLIKITTIQSKDKKKSRMNLTPKSLIYQLVEYIAKKRKLEKSIDIISNCLTQLGEAKTIEDLYRWERTDYTALHIKATIIAQILQVIEQVVESARVKEQKLLSLEKRQCIKISNSHKLLRYCVYAVQGPDGVKKIAWLNMDNLKNAIDIVRKEIYNEELLNNLSQYFDQFALDHDDEPINFSRGLILYGPPGTGKTVITQALPNIIGFHLINSGLSAADFMKSLVGESSRMIKDLVNRADVSPYLLCSVGIDEVDGLVPDRKDKEQKNKGEGISMMLSVIGGNKDVSNLVFMTSTNYLKKIDQAIRRRLSGHYQVGRPNPQARAQIVKSKLRYIRQKQDLLTYIVKITTNFTGAALGNLGDKLLSILKKKKRNKQANQLSQYEINMMARQAAEQFSIKLGSCTLPQIYEVQKDKKYIFTDFFLNNISKNIVLVKQESPVEYNILYAAKIQKFIDGQIIPCQRMRTDKIITPSTIQDHFKTFVKYITSGFHKGKYKVISFNQNELSPYQYRNFLRNFLGDYKKENVNKIKTILIISDYKNISSQILIDLNFLQQQYHNLYIFLYLSKNTKLNDIRGIYFKQNSQQQGYSGRIMIELSQKNKMAFQLEDNFESDNGVIFQPIIKSVAKKAINVIPQLVQFFTKQNLSYILLINNDLINENNAFEQNKRCQILQQKMMQAKNYQRAAVIIDLDSIIQLSQNASDSNFGRSMSYSIHNINIFQIILNYIQDFPKITQRSRRWITVIAKNQQLIRIIKKQLDWPKYPEEIQRERQEEEKDKEKQCPRCHQFFTDRKNSLERKCMQHPGYIIDIKSSIFYEGPIEKLKACIMMKKRCKKNKQHEENDLYVYSCCQRGISEQGCRSFHHIEKCDLQTVNDEVQKIKDEIFEQEKKKLDYYKQFNA